MQPKLLRLPFLCILLLPIACVEEAEPVDGRSASPSDLSINYDEEELAATLVRGDAWVTVRMRKGPERPRDWQGDPAVDSPHTFDLAIIDRHGAALLLEIGGDRLVDPTWLDQLAPPPEHGRIEDRRTDLLLAAELLDELREDEEVERRFAWELRGLENTVGYMLDFGAFEGAEEIRAEPTPPLDEGLTLADDQRGQLEITSPPLGATTYIHQIYIRKASCCWSFGEHSAVEVRSYNSGSGSLYALVITANHGRSATDPSMATASGCPRAWGGRANYLPTLQPYYYTDTYAHGDAGGCGTAYGLTSSKHVCNDDTLAQYYNVKYNANASWITCADGSLRTSAPNCNY